MTDPTSTERVSATSEHHARKRSRGLRFCQANAILFLILGTVWAVATGVFLLLGGGVLVALGVSAGYFVSLGFALVGILLYLPQWQQFTPARRNVISVFLFISILDVAAITLAVVIGL
jgi:hypothetical protein